MSPDSLQSYQIHCCHHQFYDLATPLTLLVNLAANLNTVNTVITSSEREPQLFPVPSLGARLVTLIYISELHRSLLEQEYNSFPPYSVLAKLKGYEPG